MTSSLLRQPSAAPKLLAGLLTPLGEPLRRSPLPPLARPRTVANPAGIAVARRPSECAIHARQPPATRPRPLAGDCSRRRRPWPRCPCAAAALYRPFARLLRPRLGTAPAPLASAPRAPLASAARRCPLQLLLPLCHCCIHTPVSPLPLPPTAGCRTTRYRCRRGRCPRAWSRPSGQATRRPGGFARTHASDSAPLRPAPVKAWLGQCQWGSTGPFSSKRLCNIYNSLVN